MNAKKILLVDDEVEIVDFFRDFFEELEYNVTVANDGQEGLDTLRDNDFDLVITDMMMPRMIGIEFLKRAKEIKPDQKIIMMSGVKEESMIAKAKKAGAWAFLNKPVSLNDVEEKVTACLEGKEAP